MMSPSDYEKRIVAMVPAGGRIHGVVRSSLGRTDGG